MASEIEVCNRALTLIGLSSVESLDGNTQEQQSCRIHYSPVVRSALRLDDWNFAISTGKLNHIPRDEPILEGVLLGPLDRVYRFPDEAERIHDVYDADSTRADFRFDRDTNNNKLIVVSPPPQGGPHPAAEPVYDRPEADPPLAVEVDPVEEVEVVPLDIWARFSLRDVTPDRWSDDFTEGVVYRLAHMIALSLRRGEEEAGALLEQSEKLLGIAIRINSSEGGGLLSGSGVDNEIIELALTRAGLVEEGGRATSSTSGHARLLRQVWDLHRRTVLQAGEFTFARRFIELPFLGRLEHPSTTGYWPFFYEYASEYLKVLRTYLRRRNSTMEEYPFSLAENVPFTYSIFHTGVTRTRASGQTYYPGTNADGTGELPYSGRSDERIPTRFKEGDIIPRVIILDTGFQDSSNVDVRSTAEVIIDVQDLSRWSDLAKSALAWKFALELTTQAYTDDKNANMANKEYVFARYTKEIRMAQSQSSQEAGNRKTQTYPRRAFHLEGRVGRGFG